MNDYDREKTINYADGFIRRLEDQNQALIEQLSKVEIMKPRQVVINNGIQWEKYDPYDRGIESHVNHLVTNGHRVLIAQHASKVGTNEYEWQCGASIITWVTHWAKINLPL